MDLSDLVIREGAAPGLTNFVSISDAVAVPPYGVHALRGGRFKSAMTANGLLRQFMPKGADLPKASQEYLNNVADLMNARPRQTLGWKTPNQALEEEITQFNSRVALDS